MKLKPFSLLGLSLVLQGNQRWVAHATQDRSENEPNQESSTPDPSGRPFFGGDRARGGGGSGGSGRSGMQHCTPLDVGEKLVYKQFEAGASNNDLLRKVNGIINGMLAGVTSVSVALGGEGINRKVGEFKAIAKITLIKSPGVEVEQCYSIPYEIQDTDECKLLYPNPMRHKCDHRSTICINTIGSYECGCAKGYWGEKCGGGTSTEECCAIFGDRRERREACREDFRCTNDPCKGHTCGQNAWCRAGSGYGDYTCECKEGFKKNERGECESDAKVTVDYCENHSCPYNCRCNVEEQGYRCKPMPGYKAYFDEETVPVDYYQTSGGKRLDKTTRCVDMRTPDIAIKGPNPITYYQGDTYEELGVTVTDQNEDESTRTIEIHYNEPFGAYFRQPGEYTVRYSLENWLLSDGLISKTRTVKVADVDECVYDGPHAEFRHQCSPEATCINTHGSYECACADGYEGDGLLSGSGCLDVTPPTITCVGRGCVPAKFRACNCVGMVSDDGSRRNLPEHLDDAAIEANIKLLKGDLCGFGEGDEEGGVDGEGESGEGGGDGGDEVDEREWKPERCFSAIDVQYGGKVVDLSKNITMGMLEKAPGHDRMWRVPHWVKDDAGNRASAVYFYIQVEEVDVLSTIYGTAETLKRDGMERNLLWGALLMMSSLLLFPLAWKVLVGLNVVLAAAKVLFFPYSMINSREDFELGYGFLLRVRAMGMGNEIDRERKIAAYWAQLMDEANAKCVDHDDD